MMRLVKILPICSENLNESLSDHFIQHIICVGMRSINRNPINYHAYSRSPNRNINFCTDAFTYGDANSNCYLHANDYAVPNT